MNGSGESQSESSEEESDSEKDQNKKGNPKDTEAIRSSQNAKEVPGSQRRRTPMEVDDGKDEREHKGPRETNWLNRQDEGEIKQRMEKRQRVVPKLQQRPADWGQWRSRPNQRWIGKEKWNFDWFRRAGLEVLEAGQGRGGECQYLSALIMAEPEAWEMKSGRVVVNKDRVDALRSAVADWMDEHQNNTFPSGPSLRESALADWKGRGKRRDRWNRYLAGVRDGMSGQWGDDCTLAAVSAVLGRPVYVLSCGRDKEVRVYDLSVPEGWGSAVEGSPLLLAHTANYHYCPVRVRRGGDWDFVLASVEDSPLRSNQGNRFLADQRLIIREEEWKEGEE